jgi:LysM repeat protein
MLYAWVLYIQQDYNCNTMINLINILGKQLKIYFVLLFLIISVSCLPTYAFAQVYGSGSYGGGNYGTGEGGSSSNPVTNVVNSIAAALAPSCGSTQPGNTPQQLYAAVPQDGTSIMLYFTDASGSYDHYVVRYGLSSGNYMFGLDNAGGKGIRTVTLNALLPNTDYYFEVRAGNGCATGPWSNEISATTRGIVSTNNLNIISTQVSPDTTQPIPTPTPACQSYTVKSGDTLYAVAKNLLGNGNLYQQLAKLNEDTYPSLKTSNNLHIGWTLIGSCDTQKQQSSQQSGYNVNVSVKDANNKPVAGATVTLHSTPQTAKTDNSGIAHFRGIDKGQHQVLISYANYKGQESINLSGDVKTFNVNVTVQPAAFVFSPIAIGAIILLLIIVIGLIIFIFRLQKKIAIRGSK